MKKMNSHLNIAGRYYDSDQNGYYKKKNSRGKKRKVVCPSLSTPETINLGDEDMPSMSPSWERPPGMKAKKNQEKKQKHKEEKITQLEAVVERITNDKKTTP